MDYTNMRRIVAITCSALMLFSCSALKLKPEAEPVTLSEDGRIIQKIPDPYLEQDSTIPDGAEAKYQSALAKMADKDWQAAEALFQAMIVEFPTLSGPCVNLGIAQWRQEKLEQASESFNQAIELNGLNGDAYINFGLMLREQGQFEDAEALYQHALTVWPHNREAHINLGILYDIYMGKFAEAVEHYEMAQKLLDEPDRKLEGWIMDTKRRLPPEPEPEVEPEPAPEAQPPAEEQPGKAPAETGTPTEAKQ